MTNKPPFQFDSQAPLVRIHPETRKANDALRDYWQMGSGRSLNRLMGKYREAHGANDANKSFPPTIHFTTLENWSSRYRWQKRINRAKEIQDERDEAVFEKTRLAVRMNAIGDYDKLRNLANDILDKGPDFLKTTTRHIQGKWEKIEGKDGKTYHVQLSPDREIVTVALDGTLAIKALQLATKLCRQAVGGMDESNGPMVQINQNNLTQNVIQAQIEQLPQGRRDDFLSLLLQAERAITIDAAPNSSSV